MATGAVGEQRRILLRRTQISCQQLFAAEDVERQETVVVVVAAEVATVLIAVDNVVGRIEIENQFGRRFFERSDELLEVS